MVLHVIDALAASQPNEIAVVVGHGGDLVAETVDKSAHLGQHQFATQHEQHGTGHARWHHRLSAPSAMRVIVPGDTPLLAAETINRLVSEHTANDHHRPFSRANSMTPPDTGASFAN